MNIQKYYEIERNKKLHIYFKTEKERCNKRNLVMEEIRKLYNPNTFIEIENKYKYIRINEISKIIIQKAKNGEIEIEESLIKDLYPSTTAQITMLKQSSTLKIIAKKYKIFNDNKITSNIKRIKFICNILRDKEIADNNTYFFKKAEELRQEIFKYSSLPLKDILAYDLSETY